ncbi:hypothetical protein J1C56_13435 [Aminobacter anthyllidis]|uniref:Uncharacterized protein n=1 Tax=Aminobacter anthyllidis TaxID=1035067 RepID=A0A9X1ABD9_9HYPH|nr:hypothetical protein [Aminobacter anthyllidis]MBT1156598.1 hypothetical protein [Aminobacter anthyllidis]MDH4988408.1 hypothetical protein [Aminobacter anthyllidis]
MNFVIEFYRLREEDGAHATLDRVSLEALDIKAAVGIAGSLFHTLAMPQVPDQVRICDMGGRELYDGPASGTEPALP